MVNGLAFCVIYRARVHPGKEATYIAAWSRLTKLLRSRGSLGSRLHHGADGIWYAYAQWPNARTREEAFKLPSVDPVADQQVVGCISEYFPEIVLEPIEDQLVPASEFA